MSALAPMAALSFSLAFALLASTASPARGAVVPRGAECEAGTARVTGVGAPSASRHPSWPTPLDRMVSVAATESTLREALDRIATTTGVALAYSPELLPLARRVCVVVDRRPLGDVLVELVAGSGVAPVVIGASRVVLAPARVAAGADATPSTSRSAAQLDRVVVTGTASGGTERASPFALTVVEGTSLAPNAGATLASVFDGVVPGVWVWAQSPVSPLARFGSVRGASSLGVSSPKIYLDGIEVANSLMVAHLDPTQIERVEVIRGPQGAALYGADAISGVVQIVTRHEGVDSETPPTRMRASFGSTASSYVDAGVLAQAHGVNLRRGSAARSVGLGVSLTTLGAFTPGAQARQLLATTTVRHVAESMIVTGLARFDGTNADVPVSPLLRGYLTSMQQRADSTPQRSRHYTVGGTATWQASEQSTHALTLGIDGYRLSGSSTDAMPLPSASDSALRAARGGADRASVRYHNTRRLGVPETRGTTLTLGAEHSVARENSSGLGGVLADRPAVPGSVDAGEARGPQVHESPDDRSGVTWWNNTGILAQAQVALGGSLFLSGGARIEHLSGPSTLSQLALLPMLGTSWVLEHGPATLKLRAAYGRGIRPARTVMRGATWMGGAGREVLTALEPEEQAGTEAGVDAMWGSAIRLHLTRFDQRASGLVQPVALLDPYGSIGGSRGKPRVLYQLQNVGAINNRGWEMQGGSAIGPLTLGATLSLVTSRVARLANGYRGDLREGDQMLEVPARTVGVNAMWKSARWSVGGSLARAWNWVNYDKIALANAIIADPTGALVPVGPALRDFWKNYEGSTRLGAQTSFALRGHTVVTLSGDNLLNHQVGEPDNVTVVPGRTVRVGLTTGF